MARCRAVILIEKNHTSHRSMFQVDKPKQTFRLKTSEVTTFWYWHYLSNLAVKNGMADGMAIKIIEQKTTKGLLEDPAPVCVLILRSFSQVVIMSIQRVAY